MISTSLALLVLQLEVTVPAGVGFPPAQLPLNPDERVVLVQNLGDATVDFADGVGMLALARRQKIKTASVVLVVGIVIIVIHQIFRR
jgi:hypothetical protein